MRGGPAEEIAERILDRIPKRLKTDVRYLVLSDIHANLDAFDAVLAATPPGRWDRVLVLGDLVGYGAEPNAVVDRVRALEPARGHPRQPRQGRLRHRRRQQLQSHRARSPPRGPATAHGGEPRVPARAADGPGRIDDRIEICHGAPFDEDHYIFDGNDARHALDAARATGVPVRPHALAGRLLRRRGRVSAAPVPEADETSSRCSDGAQYLVNVGSVGQPRDGDPRAA